MTNHKSYVGMSGAGWLSLIALSIAALASSNPWLTLFCFWAVPVFVVLLWRRFEPPILLFAVMVQWVEVSAKVVHADILDVSISEFFADSVIVESTLRGLIGLIVLALGMRFSLRGLPAPSTGDLWRDGWAISIPKLWHMYLLAFVLSLALQGLVWLVPGLTQILLPIFNLKWAFFFLLAYVVFLQQKNYAILWLTVAMEVVVGFSGFFSGFKQVFFILAVAYMSLGVRLRGRRLAFVGAIALVVLALSVVWMTVREDYRNYVNAGTGMQVLKVSVERRLTKFVTLVSDAEFQDYVEGADKLAKRIAYVDMFAYVLNRVPESVAHTDGKLWGKAIRHVLMPRIFFPEKARLRSDSELTMVYTGLVLASDSRGTSISMGYMAESYIDFGPVFMYVPILILGALWGGIYRYFVSRDSQKLFGYAVSVAVIVNANQFGIHLTKLVGSMIMSFIVMALILKFVLPHVRGWVTASQR